MKQVEVRFGTGNDVLSAYWGFLSDGGLIIPDEETFDEGQPVSLSVHIDSCKKHYALYGRIVRRQLSNRRAIVAFDPGEPQDMLLTAALSEAEDVPARRHTRHQIECDARLGDDGVAMPAHLIDVSVAGCCVRVDNLDAHALPVGSKVTVLCGELTATGEIVWSHGHDRGVCFDEQSCSAAAAFVARL